jgi:hypothetical protein
VLFDLVVGTGVDPVTFRFSDEQTRRRDLGRSATAQVVAHFD